MATNRDWIDSSPPPCPPKRTCLDDVAAEMAFLMRPLNQTEPVLSNEDEEESCLTP